MTMTMTLTVTIRLHRMHLASFLYRFVCAASHDDLQRYVFNHPIDFHFIADSVANWPKLHLQILKLDACGRIEPLDCKVWNLHSPWLYIGLRNFKLIHQVSRVLKIWRAQQDAYVFQNNRP